MTTQQTLLRGETRTPLRPIASGLSCPSCGRNFPHEAGLTHCAGDDCPGRHLTFAGFKNIANELIVSAAKYAESLDGTDGDYQRAWKIVEDYRASYGATVLPPETPNLSAANALAAIQARLNGAFNDPALLAFGPLSSDRDQDVLAIAKLGLQNYPEVSLPPVRAVIFRDGGVIHEIYADSELSFTVYDTDVDGTAPSEIVELPDLFLPNMVTEVYASGVSAAEVDADLVREVFKAVEAQG